MPETKSPEAQAALRALETDQLGGKVGSENSPTGAQAQDTPIATIRRSRRVEIRLAFHTFGDGQRRLGVAQFEHRGAPDFECKRRLTFAPSEIPQLIAALQKALDVALSEGL